jgi:hypothetical protein
VSDATKEAAALLTGNGPNLSVEIERVLQAAERGAASQSETVRIITTRRLAELATEDVKKAVDSVELAISKLPASGKEPAVNMAAALAIKYSSLRPPLKLLASEVESLDEELGVFSALHEALRRSRQDVAGEILGAIGATVAEYYLAIHPPGNPDEATGAPSIEVQRHGKGSAFVRGKFRNEGIKDPRWVYSDGHLDTVGICVFLALRRLRADAKGDSKLLILDDIVLSIDLGHARRLIDLLKAEFSDHQTIILTHNGLFAYWCTYLMPGMRRLRIRSWTLEAGPTVGDMTSARERLEGALPAGEPREIGMQIMNLMDEWCAEARYAYTLAVPARHDEQYTLADIWQPLVKRLRELAKELKSDLGGVAQALDRIPDLFAVRNALAAHENDFAKEYPRQTVVEMARDVLLIATTLRCQECAAFVVKPPSAMVLSCRCGKAVFTRAH